MVKVLFVCLGNICRSPLAQGVLRRRVAALGAAARHITVDSAATAGWHMGEAPDARAQEAALRRGMDIAAQRSRQLTATDFRDYDYILVMDAANLADAQAVRPPGGRARLALLLDYAPQLEVREVPDPYWGGATHFDAVIDMIEAAADGFLAEILAPGATDAKGAV